ncbi:MAG: FTR1 family protein [Actinomycetota bacterium]|nr:FTR1 family protein [Actinomycetota bacterium]
MIATFVIFLREGIEASMIVAILLAYLDRIGQRRHFRDVLLGVAAAVALASGGGVAAYLTIRTYAGSRTQTIFETATFAVAAVLLTYMTFWMRSHARTISADLRARTEAALGRGERLGLALLAFQAVGREGVETAVFTLAIVFATGTRGTLAGGTAGIALALVVAVLVYRLGRRLNLARFFTVVGALLMVFAAGLVADTVENLQQLGWVHLLDHPMWNTGHVLSEGSALGDVVHSLLGYAQQPTPLQLVAYVAYLAAALAAFLRSGRPGSGHARSSAHRPAGPDAPAAA